MQIKVFIGPGYPQPKLPHHQTSPMFLNHALFLLLYTCRMEHSVPAVGNSNTANSRSL